MLVNLPTREESRYVSPFPKAGHGSWPHRYSGQALFRRPNYRAFTGSATLERDQVMNKPEADVKKRDNTSRPCLAVVKRRYWRPTQILLNREIRYAIK